MAAHRGTQPPTFRDGVITGLVARRGQGDRVTLHLDGRPAFALAAVVADHARLRAGDALSAEDQRGLYEKDAPYRARERALRFLEARDRSSREVAARLRQAGFEPQVTEQTVTWLRDLGYVDDRRFAAAYSAEKQRTGWGTRRIRAELAKKGVERRVVDEIVALQEEAEASGSTEDVPEAVVRLEETVRRRFGAQFASDQQGAERRLAGYLARRGYDWETVARMARMLRAEASASAEQGEEESHGGAADDRSP